MRLPLGRPDITAWSELFDLPEADAPTAQLPTVTFLGVSTLLFDDGDSAVMFDGFFSRPSLLRVGLGKVAPNGPRIGAALDRIGFGVGGRQLGAVVPVHSHFDHVMDSAVVAQRTGALMVGGESTRHVAVGGGLPPEKQCVVAAGDELRLGAWTLTFAESEHCPPDRFPGVIREPVVPPVRAAAYRCGEAWSVLVTHTSGKRSLVQGSAGFVPGAVDGWQSEVVHLGVGQLGRQSVDYITEYWRHTVQAVGARRVVLTHWDDFFRSLDRPLRALPYAGDDLAVTMSVLSELAARDGVRLHFPSLWHRELPWT